MGGPGLPNELVSIIRLHGLTHELDLELDPIRSQYPNFTAGEGYLSVTAGAASMQSLSLQVPSGHAFVLQNLWIANEQEGLPLYIWDGPGISAPKGRWITRQSTAEYFDNIKGMKFQSIPLISYNGSQIAMKLGGLIYERDGE